MLYQHLPYPPHCANCLTTSLPTHIGLKQAVIRYTLDSTPETHAYNKLFQVPFSDAITSFRLMMDIRLMINVSKIFQPLPYKVIMMICNDDDADLQWR